ncbi:unnamed protein product [Moneuplotes crassus]|uniref:PH domain-containing protein n=2 Tax=Euplotes crassus TaxID=5936 RepID=A0AAD1XBD4_EUPCR|nr:unnamed protein product [Moneuplotes crassus]
MASDEIDVKDLLKASSKVFKKYNGRVSMKRYKKVLESIGVIPEDEYQLQEYFQSVDQDGDGYVTYEDFEYCVLQPLIGEPEQETNTGTDDLSYAEQSLLTLEKLSEFKSLFNYYKKNNRAKISDMKQDILDNFKGFVITLSEFDTFFKDFEYDQSVKEDQFYDIFNFYEQKILEKASVFGNRAEDTQKEIDVQMQNQQEEQKEEKSSDYVDDIIGDGEGSDDENEPDPETALQEIIDCVIDMDDFESMNTKQMGMIILKLKSKADKVCEKVERIEKKNTKYKNQLDVLKNEKEYFKNKNTKLQAQNEDLKEKNYKMEGDIEDLMRFENDFQRMVQQCEEKDMEILRLEDEVDDQKRKHYDLEREFRSAQENVAPGLSQDGLLERIQNLEYELSSYKSYVAQDLPENKDFQDDSRMTSRISLKPRNAKEAENKDKSEEEFHQSNKLMELVEDLTEQNRGLEKSEQEALIKFEKEYSKKIRILEQTDKIKKDLENQMALIMIENETLLKENQWRKEFNVTNAKEIESIVKENKILKMKVQDLENGNANWRLKYENQELIKKNVETNPHFRQTYVEIMSQRKSVDQYRGRLSTIVKAQETARATQKQRLQTNFFGKKTGTKVENIVEEADEENSEEGNLADELGGLEDFGEPDFGDLEQRDGSEHEDKVANNDGIYRASEFDNDRFTLLNKERTSHINIGGGLQARDFKKVALESIVEDEFYDPVAEQVRELKEQQEINKTRVMKEIKEKEKEEKEEKEENKEELENSEDDEDQVDEELFNEIGNTTNTVEAIRATVAKIVKPNLVTSSTQTICKTEEVQIDNTKAMIIYSDPVIDEPISIEGKTEVTNETLESKTAERIDPPMSYVQDTTESLTSGDTGRVMLKMQNKEGEVLLIDKGKNKIVETNTIDVQTDIELKDNVVPKIEKREVAPVAAIDEDEENSANYDSSEGEEEHLDDDGANELFGGLEHQDSREPNLRVITEEDDEDGTFKTRPKQSVKEEDKKEDKKEEKKEDKNQKVNQETTQRIKTILEQQIRKSQIGGRGQSNLRDKSIINRISRIKNFDFLALRSKDNKNYKRVKRILERYDEFPKGKKKEQLECFTEYIYKIDTNMKKSKRKIMITPNAFYQLSKNFSVVYRVPIESIKALTLIKKSANVIAIHCPGTFDHLIEIVRRTELVMFLMHMFEIRNLKFPRVNYADGLKTKSQRSNKPEEKKLLKFDPSVKHDVSKTNVTLLNKLSGINFINSQKYGYLSKRAKGWFKEWSEKFCVVTNVGLLYYDDADKKPKNLFPIIDATILAVDKKTYKRNFVFQIKAFKWEITFAAQSEQDYLEWMEAFEKLQKETDKRKDALINNGILNNKLMQKYNSINDPNKGS